MRVALFAAVAILAACNESIFGPPTESVCPTESTITYENFGKQFMQDYCTSCHDEELVGEERHGAPSFHDFDTLYGIRAVSDHIDETTAAGPAATNTGMPPDKCPGESGKLDTKCAQPSMEERTKLGEWIACGMPGTPEVPTATARRSPRR